MLKIKLLQSSVKISFVQTPLIASLSALAFEVFFLATLFLTISHKFPLGLEPGYFLSSFVQFRHVDPLEKILNELWLVAWSTLMHKYAMCICSSSFTGSSSTYLTPFTIVPGGKNESPAVWDLDMTLQIIICSHLDSCLFLMCFLCV